MVRSHVLFILEIQNSRFSSHLVCGEVWNCQPDDSYYQWLAIPQGSSNCPTASVSVCFFCLSPSLKAASNLSLSSGSSLPLPAANGGTDSGGFGCLNTRISSSSKATRRIFGRCLSSWITTICCAFLALVRGLYAMMNSTRSPISTAVSFGS